MIKLVNAIFCGGPWDCQMKKIEAVYERYTVRKGSEEFIYVRQDFIDGFLPTWEFICINP